MTVLTLSIAIQEGRLEAFIREQESSGIAPISEVDFNETTSAVIKTSLSDDQTSCSPQPGGSGEK